MKSGCTEISGWEKLGSAAVRSAASSQPVLGDVHRQLPRGDVGHILSNAALLSQPERWDLNREVTEHLGIFFSKQGHLHGSQVAQGVQELAWGKQQFQQSRCGSQGRRRALTCRCESALQALLQLGVLCGEVLQGTLLAAGKRQAPQLKPHLFTFCC